MRHLMALLLSLGAGTIPLQAAGPSGISIYAGRTFLYSSRSHYGGGNYDFYGALGYNITPSFLVGLKIYTGTDYLNAEPGMRVSGYFDGGGGSLEALYRIGPEARLRPVVAAGYDLATILSAASGYNGNGFHLQAGCEYFLSENFSLELDAVYKYRHYSALIIRGEEGGIEEPLIEGSFGINLGIGIYFNIVP